MERPSTLYPGEGRGPAPSQPSLAVDDYGQQKRRSGKNAGGEKLLNPGEKEGSAFQQGIGGDLQALYTRGWA